MSYIDIAVLVILVLGALLGLLKGFYKTFFGFLATTVSFVIVYFITGPITKSLVGISAIEGFIQGPLTKMMSAMKFLVGDPTYFATLFFSIAIFFALFTIVRMLMMIVTVVLKNLTRDKKVTGLSRLLGFVVGAAKGGLTVVVLLVITMTFSGTLPLKYQDQLYGDGSITSKYVGKYIYKYTNEFVSKQVGIIFGEEDGTGDDTKLADMQTAINSAKDGVNAELDKVLAKSDWLYGTNGPKLDAILNADGSCTLEQLQNINNMTDVYATVEGVIEPKLKKFIRELPTNTVSQCLSSAVTLTAISAELTNLVASFESWAVLVDGYEGDFAAVTAAFEIFESKSNIFLTSLAKISPDLVPVA